MQTQHLFSNDPYSLLYFTAPPMHQNELVCRDELRQTLQRLCFVIERNFQRCCPRHCTAQGLSTKSRAADVGVAAILTTPPPDKNIESSTIESSTAGSPPTFAIESDEHKVRQRQKQIGFGKSTLGYKNYIRLVPKEQRESQNEKHPVTPRANQKCSKRAWYVMSAINFLYCRFHLLG